MKKLMLVLTAAVGVLAVAAGLFYMNRPVVTIWSKYPPMKLEERSKAAAVIVQGTVISRGASQRTRIPTSEPPGSFSEYPETPITIRVDNGIKGAKAGDEIIYWEPGGEFLTEIVVTENEPVKEGDRVILFLNKHGRSEGDPIDAALRVVEGQVRGKHLGSQDLKEFVARVKAHIN